MVLGWQDFFGMSLNLWAYKVCLPLVLDPQFNFMSSDENNPSSGDSLRKRGASALHTGLCKKA
jgi:hypothetical protein